MCAGSHKDQIRMLDALEIEGCEHYVGAGN